MENPKLKDLESSIEALDELSKDLAARCSGWNKDHGDLDGSSDALKRFCDALRSRYEDILAASETDPILTLPPTKVGYLTHMEELGE